MINPYENPGYYNLGATFQVNWAARIARRVRLRGLPKEALVCAFECAYQESKIRMYANENNPASLLLPHDATGSDHGSVGLFQQQVGGAANSTANWGTTEELMNAEISTDRFLDVLAGAVATSGGWGAGQSPGDLVQAVQNSEFPDAYDQHEGYARALADALWDDAVDLPEEHGQPEEDDDMYSVLQIDGLTYLVTANYFQHVAPEELRVARETGQCRDGGKARVVPAEDLPYVRSVALGSE